MLSKRLGIINWLPKSMLLILIYQALVDLVTKAQYDLARQGLEKKIEQVDKNIPNTSELVKNTDCNTRITEIESKILSVTRLVTTAALSTKA